MVEKCDPSGCWLVAGPEGDVLALLVGNLSEVVGECRLYAGFYRNGRSGSVRLLTAPEAMVHARARKHHAVTTALMSVPRQAVFAA